MTFRSRRESKSVTLTVCCSMLPPSWYVASVVGPLVSTARAEPARPREPTKATNRWLFGDFGRREEDERGLVPTPLLLHSEMDRFILKRRLPRLGDREYVRSDSCATRCFCARPSRVIDELVRPEPPPFGDQVLFVHQRRRCGRFLWGSCMLSYVVLRTKGRQRRYRMEQVADGTLSAGLLVMAASCGLISYELVLAGCAPSRRRSAEVTGRPGSVWSPRRTL
jgi:hypothetical protein